MAIAVHVTAVPTRLARVLSSELAKAARRPVTWTVTGALAAYTLVIGQAFPYFSYRRAAASQFVQEIPVDVQLAALLPADVAHRVTGDASSLGLYLAAVLGALLAGSEYGWRTVRTLGLQGPGRLALATGKPLAAAVVLLGVVLAVLAASTGLSAAVALGHGAGMALPSSPGVPAAVGAAWLVLATGCMLGLALAVVTRNASLGMGGTLLLLVGVEGLVDVAARTSPPMAAVQQWLPGYNADALAAGFPGALQQLDEFARSFPVPPSRATWTLVGYVTVCVLAAALVPLRRDVTE